MANFNAHLKSRNKLTEDLGIFAFEIDEEIKFIPGQYAALGVITRRINKPIIRPLSIASTPRDLPNIEFLIRWVKNGGQREDGMGRLTTELFELSDPEIKASEFTIGNAKGRFYLDNEDDREVIMVATGTGIAPFVSMLRALNAQEKSQRRYVLIHGVSTCDDLAYQVQLDDLVLDSPIDLTYKHASSRAQCDPFSEINYVGEYFFNRDPKRSGRIVINEINEAIEHGKTANPKIEDILGHKLTPEEDVVMLCGNPNMINNMTRLLEARGFIDGKDVMSEKYWAAKKETFTT